MKITSPKTSKTIQDISLTFPQKQECFALLEEKTQSNQKIMIAVSGGADSMLTACVVYDFFVQKKYPIKNLFFIHCNHNTRISNADDEKLIKSFCTKTQYTITQRASNKKGSEAELRSWRYKEFNLHTKLHNIDQLVFGHNLTDRIESTFLNILRGANSNGFLAMKTQENHHLLGNVQVLRPLLGLTKDEILAICKKNNIPFLTDPTNNDNTTSLRNKLRNTILPQLYALSHKQNSRSNSCIESFKNIYQRGENNLSKYTIILKPIPQSPSRNASFAYQRTINPNEISQETIMQMMKTLDISNNISTVILKERSDFLQKNESGYKYFNGTYIFKAHKNIYIINAPQFFWKKTIDKSKIIDKVGTLTREGKKYTINNKEYIGATIRFPQKGDTHKKKTRNEWCINHKIPIFRRNFLPIIAINKEILHVFATQDTINPESETTTLTKK